MDNRRSSSRMRDGVTVATLATLAACALFAAPASAQQAAPAHTISVVGEASVKPTPQDAKSNASIVKAVADARAAATPKALADGRRRAAELATLTGLPLGELVSVAQGDEPASPFYFPGPFGVDGTFAPGRYCGIVRTSVFRTGADGKRKRVGSRQRRTCRVPPSVSASITMVFAAG